ncbi:MAG: hypothetical protein ACMUJM_00555 [bacterium]
MRGIVIIIGAILIAFSLWWIYCPRGSAGLVNTQMNSADLSQRSKDPNIDPNIQSGSHVTIEFTEEGGRFIKIGCFVYSHALE